MGRGFFAGVGWGLVASVVALAAASLILPLPEPVPVAVVPQEAGPPPDAQPTPEAPEVPDLPSTIDSRVEAPRMVLPQEPQAAARAPERPQPDRGPAPMVPPLAPAPDVDVAEAGAEPPRGGDVATAPDQVPDAQIPPRGASAAALPAHPAPLALPDLQTVAPVVTAQRPLVAVVLLDLGLSAEERARIAAQDLPITIAIDPRQPDAAAVGDAWREAGHEVVRLGPEELDLQSQPVPAGHLRAANGILAPAEQGLPFRTIGAQPRRDLDRAAFRAVQTGATLLIGMADARTAADLADWRAGYRAGAVELGPLSAARRYASQP